MTHPFGTADAFLAEIPGAGKADIFMPAKSSTLVYLIHGVTGTPLEMKFLGRRLSRQGWDIYIPTLPGHCSTFREMIRSDEAAWLRQVVAQLAFLRRHYDHLFVAGLSAGALMALEGSLHVPVDGIGLLSPTLFYDGWNVPWTMRLLPFGIKRIPTLLQCLIFHFDGAPYGIKDPALQARIREAYHPFSQLRALARQLLSRLSRKGPEGPERSASAEAVGYPVFSLKTLADLDRLYRKVEKDLSSVKAPTLILQAREDDFTSPKNAEFIYDGISSPDKKLVLLDDCYHVITVDKQRNTVAEEMSKFVESHLGSGPDRFLAPPDRSRESNREPARRPARRKGISL
ncbi:MAG TPA: alpha/beta fold hydrolase [Candidatus Manganitrophaceae bacterium]|nr:alpha/beta fold hydrolase [Candidatus Manganitrophaceae bacterium]